MADTRNKIETNRRVLLSDEIQELSKREMGEVNGGLTIVASSATPIDLDEYPMLPPGVYF